MRSTHRYEKVATNQSRRQFRLKLLLFELIVLILLASLFISINFLKPNLSKSIIKATLKLQPQSRGFETWLNPPVGTRRAYHLFNYSNALNVIKKPDKVAAELHDTPAFVYDLQSRKSNVTWSGDNSLIHYQVERIIKRHPTDFDSTLINQTGFFVDMLRALIRANFEKKPSDTFSMIAPASAFQEVNPIDLLEGFNPDHFGRVKEKMVGPNTEKFGFVYRQNGSRLYNVTSQTRLEIKGQMVDFASELSSFKINSDNPYSFPVYDGLTFPTNLANKKQLFVFNSDFCRPVLLEYQKSISKFGFSELYEYKLKLIDHNKCHQTDDSFHCEEVEQLDVSKCFSSTLPDESIYLSKAHFYGAKEETIQNLKIHGFNSSQEKHDSLIYFEPFSGTPIHGTYRIQLNVQTYVDPESKGRNAVKRLLPIFWIDQKVQLLEAGVKKLRMALFIMNNQSIFIYGTLLVLSIVFIVIVELISRFCLRH